MRYWKENLTMSKTRGEYDNYLYKRAEEMTPEENLQVLNRGLISTRYLREKNIKYKDYYDKQEKMILKEIKKIKDITNG